MKRLALILTAVLWTIVMSTSLVQAQTAPETPEAATQVADSADIVASLTKDGKVVLEQPEGLQQRLKFKTGVEESEVNAEDDKTTTKTRQGHWGYRVEVFADNNVRTAKAQASSRKRMLQARLPQYRSYLVFESPFWRVRIGDFTSKADAESAMAEVRKLLPQTASALRIVRSTINPQ